MYVLHVPGVSTAGIGDGERKSFKPPIRVPSRKTSIVAPMFVPDPGAGKVPGAKPTEQTPFGPGVAVNLYQSSSLPDT